MQTVIHRSSNQARHTATVLLLSHTTT